MGKGGGGSEAKREIDVAPSQIFLILPDKPVIYVRPVSISVVFGVNLYSEIHLQDICIYSVVRLSSYSSVLLFEFSLDPISVTQVNAMIRPS